MRTKKHVTECIKLYNQDGGGKMLVSVCMQTRRPYNILKIENEKMRIG